MIRKVNRTGKHFAQRVFETYTEHDYFSDDGVSSTPWDGNAADMSNAPTGPVIHSESKDHCDTPNTKGNTSQLSIDNKSKDIAGRSQETAETP